VVSVYSRSAVSKWSVAIGIPRDLLAAPWRRSLLVLLAGTVLVLGSALAASWFIGRHLAHAMRALVPPALALGQGHAVQVPPLPLAEANEVAGALNRTSMLLQQAMQRALHDPLTGLPNRTLFDQFLASQIAVCRRTGASLSVLYLDLDGFKRVNDRHGHAIGDELLRRVAGCLEHSVRESDLPARLGGDEFAVVLVDTGEEGAARVAQQLQAALLRPGDETTSAPNVAASIGIAEFPQAADSAEALLRRADEAMYEAKTTNGRPVFAPHRGRHRHHDAS
jgi:diguanylate cyclase (GGDEF)-like protein